MGGPDADRPVIVSLLWEAITIEVRYVPEWLGTTGHYRIAHLDIMSVQPERAPLPITETGYRSCFLPREEVDAEGGPEAYVRAWLEVAAKEPEWRNYVATTQQLSLF
jgi:hypothetical protein